MTVDVFPVNTPLRVVQVGLGDWGRDWAWRVIPAVDEVQLVAYVDSDPRALALLERKLPGSAARGFQSLDAALTTAALEAGFHVLVEKPFAETLKCAQDLVDLAASRDRTLMVSQNYRFFPAARAAARLVADGGLGRLYAISIDFRRNAAAPPRPRRRHHSDTQPLLVDMSIHHFDLLRMLLGREPDSISCDSVAASWSGFDGPPAALASIRFGDVVVGYRGSWISAGPITPWAGEWRMEFEDGQVYWTSRGDRGVLNDRVVIRPRRGRPRVVPLSPMARIDRAGTLTEFATSVREGREPETSGRNNLGTLAFTLAAVQSAVQKHPVQVATAAAVPL